MNHANHDEYSNYTRELTIAVGNNDNRNSRNNRSKYGNKSKNKYDQRKGNNIRKTRSSMENADENES